VLDVLQLKQLRLLLMQLLRLGHLQLQQAVKHPLQPVEQRLDLHACCTPLWPP